MEPQDEQNDAPVSSMKKLRLFSAKEFRSQLGTSTNAPALEQFLELCHDEEYDYIFEYLENGGNCLELFQLLETNNKIPPSLTLEVVNEILLQIVSKYPQLHAAAYESCRYFLNMHLALINKMLSLTSLNKERKVILKLLTTVVTFSKKLAKEILLHVSFNPTNLEVLTKPAIDKDSVRGAFIHFLLAFLVEGEYSTISILLDKKGLLSSIINGLFYDPAEIVSMVMVTLKSHVLENPFVSKTTKMSTFSTPVVKDIVRLYNWKGPQGINSKKSLQMGQVDEEDKTVVNESVHAFLLVLCTSHKFGVIFRDHQLGLGKRTQNSLMYTVLESLERPWEHSYAGELVTKICGATPDLAKTLWSNLKTLLEPRATTRWLNAVKYAGILVDELKPAGIDFCARELSVYQLAQIVQFLVSPTPILKTIIPENGVFEDSTVKHHVLSLLVCFMKAIQNYTVAAEKWTKPNELHILKNLLAEHVARNFPSAEEVLRDWSKSEERTDRLRVIFDLLDLYESMCPNLLETLMNVNFQSFLQEIETVTMQIRAVKLFFNFESATFSLKGDLFAMTFPLILKCYFETRGADAETTLVLLLKNSGIFEDNAEEIHYWINAVLDLKHLDVDTAQTMLGIIKYTFEDVFGYLTKTQDFVENFDSKIEGNYRDVIENLRGGFVDVAAGFSAKHTGLSPLLLGALDYLTGKEQTKNFKNYFNSVLVNLFHTQTTPSLMFAMVASETYKDVVSKHVLAYIESWTKGRGCVLIKTKLALAQTVSAAFLEGDLNLDDVPVRPDQIQNCLNQVLFYFTNLAESDLTDVHVRNCMKMVKFSSPEKVPLKIFGNPVFLQRFSPTHKIITTCFLIDVIKEFPDLLDEQLQPYRAKIVNALRRVFKKASKKPTKFVHLLEVLQVFGLERRQCLEVLKFCTTLDFGCFEEDFLGCYYNVVVYVMEKYLDRIDNLKPLDDEVVGKIIELLTFLNKNVDRLDASACHKALRVYFEYFPHNLENVTVELFESIVTTKREFCRESALLAELLLGKRADFLGVFAQHSIAIASKKGLMLPLLRAAISIGANDDFLKSAYENFAPSISKGLQKPKKAGQHFETYSDVLSVLLAKFLPITDCTVYTEKIQKFDTSEPFHVQMLSAIFTKAVFANDDISEERFTTSFLTFAHITNLIFKRKDKSDDDWLKLEKIIRCTDAFFREVADDERATKFSFRALCENDSFDLYWKYCLKFGISGKAFLLEAATSLVRFVDFKDDEAKTLLEMAGSHSEFLDVMLGEDCDCKKWLLDLILALCRRWPSIMQRNHISVLFAAYNGTVSPSDRILLILLQLYEKNSDNTNFYDFKPFLWGKAAATHYSVRQDIQKALWRQPKMGDILDLLQEDWVHNTICNYPLTWGLTATKSNCQSKTMYDLTFFLPLFGSLLAPENQVPTYKFAKSGALSLTIAALSSQDREIRLAACHALARLHYHVEARQGGKDRLLWLRFIEAICRGAAVLEDVKLNNFASIFWAKMALVLTQPLHALYVPLTHYLGAKVAPDLSGIPELYTFLHTPDVNFKDTRCFILEILRDGLRTDSDFSVALHAMAFKLIMELFSSCLADEDTKRSILLIIERACKVDLGGKLLCSSYGLLSWLYEVAVTLSDKERTLLQIILRILHLVSKNRGQEFILECDLELLLETVLEIFTVNKDFLTKERVERLTSMVNDTRYEYLLRYGCKFATINTDSSRTTNLLHTIIVKWTNK